MSFKKIGPALPFITTLSLGLWANGCGSDRIEMASNDEAIQNGSTTSHPFADLTVGLTNQEDNIFCTAVVLPGGSQILTAAHCLVDFTEAKEARPVPSEIATWAPLTISGVVAVGGDTLSAGTAFHKAPNQPQGFINRFDQAGNYQTWWTSSSEPTGVQSLAKRENGSVIAAGWIGTQNNRRIALFHLGSDSVLSPNELAPGTATSLLAHGNGSAERIVVAGSIISFGKARPFLREYNNAGELVSTLIDPTDAGFSDFVINDLARAAGGALYVAGTRVGASNRPQLITFSSGLVSVAALGSGSSAISVAVTAGPSGSAIALVERGNDSLLYEVVGTVTTAPTFLSSEPHYNYGLENEYVSFRGAGITVDTLGRIIVVGETQAENVNGTIIRLTAQRTVDPSFGVHGVLTTHHSSGPSQLNHGARALVVDGDSIHVAGRAVSGGSHYLTTARYGQTRATSITGVPKVNGSVIGEVTFHPTLDLAIAQLTESIAVPEQYSLSFAPAETVDEMTCIGFGREHSLGLGGKRHAEFSVRSRDATTLDIASTPNAEGETPRVAHGDSGGGCFANGQLAGVMIKATALRSGLYGEKTTDRVGIIVRPDLVATFVNDNLNP